MNRPASEGATSPHASTDRTAPAPQRRAPRILIVTARRPATPHPDAETMHTSWKEWRTDVLAAHRASDDHQRDRFADDGGRMFE